MKRIVRLLLVCAFVPLPLACGSNTPEIPAEYLTDGGGSGDSGTALTYPAGPYGSEEGSTIQNLSFAVGWSNPESVGYDLEKLDAAPLRLSDFFNPESNPALPEVMLLNTAALWCQACRIEHEELDTKLAEFGPRGLVIVSTLFQDAQSNPAQPVHLQLWAKQFEVGFPFFLDPEYQMGAFARAETAPLNLVIDLRTMKILKKITGEGGSVIWPLVDETLTARGR
ncbi:MAG: redoxin domain-containing protein [Myxococcales bacterium]|nr:redoxin domain-containing protein [Myxococcales bacterium]MCA9629743.1 redoxin domain-containing protein [Myxococcales bacterium]